jgi:LysR family cyn operon transcriptional activator
LAAVVNHEHPLAGEKSMTLEDLQRYPLVLPTKGLQARNAFDRMTAHSGLEYNLKAEINNVNLIFKFMYKTKYVTVLSEASVIDEDGLTAIPIIAEGNVMEGCIHTLKNGYQKAAAREFIRMVNESIAIWKTMAL